MFVLLAHTLVCAQWCFAQESETQKSYDAHTIYTYAEYYYEKGFFDAAIDFLGRLTTSQDATMRSSAYRLMALCHIEKGDMAAVKKDVANLLSIDPYYSPSASENPIFLNLITTSKKTGGSTITTASQQAETIEEAPVPVTVITEDMIKVCGARTLKEALIAYVPGITNVESNDETNLAMRGLYSASQEVLLIMVNGHRLNSYSTNAARPDFSISLDKVEQIEVLRGPASSLYGGVALAGVVNIITKSGLQQNGVSANIQYGNHHQVKGSLLIGKHLYDTDITAWASIYNARGELMSLPEEEQHSVIPCPGDIIIGGFNQRPSYDYGMTLKHKGLSLLINNSFSKNVAQYSLGNSPYSYNDYRLLDGNKPGAFTRSTRLELDYTYNFNDHFFAKATTLYDAEENFRYQVVADNWSLVQYQVPVIGSPGDSIVMGDYAFQEAKWKDQTVGVQLQGGYSFKTGKHEGNLLFGLQTIRTSISDSYFLEGDQFKDVLCTEQTDVKGIASGSENLFNAYLQYKHIINKQWVINAGIRYDNKQHVHSKRVTDWSPRLSIVYMQKTWNAKVSYSKSFVDASYFCRMNTFDTTIGDPTLTPEYQYSWQASFNKHWMQNFSTELNAFYCNTTNIVMPSGMYFVNAGELKNYGLELTGSYESAKWDVNLSASWQSVDKSIDFPASGTVIYNIPNISGNLILSYKPLSNLRISAHANLIGKQTSYFQTMNMEGETVKELFNVPTHVLLNMNASYTFKWLTLKADCHNITGKRYMQGGGSLMPLYEQGRWFTVGAEIRL